LSAAYELVVIGASLGGLPALQEVLACLPEEFPAAIAICQHRRADSSSRLAHLIDECCKLPVVEPDDKACIEPGYVYLAPPDYHLLIERGWLALSVDEPVLFARPSIDVLFESAADAYGARCVGVLLTGASADGAAGMAAIQRAGGATLVQDPKSAMSPLAPRAALARMQPDFILPLSAIGPHIARECSAQGRKAHA
jgi:two-component system chemotaxis response regulator CheB